MKDFKWSTKTQKIEAKNGTMNKSFESCIFRHECIDLLTFSIRLFVCVTGLAEISSFFTFRLFIIYWFKSTWALSTLFTSLSQCGKRLSFAEMSCFITVRLFAILLAAVNMFLKQPFALLSHNAGKT